MGSRRKIAVCLCNSQVVSFFYFSRQEWKHFPGLWKWATTWPYHKLEQHGVHMYHFPTYYPFFSWNCFTAIWKKKSNGWDKVWFQNAILNNYLPFLTFHTSVEKTLKCTFATISKKKSKKKLAGGKNGKLPISKIHHVSIRWKHCDVAIRCLLVMTGWKCLQKKRKG